MKIDKGRLLHALCPCFVMNYLNYDKDSAIVNIVTPYSNVMYGFFDYQYIQPVPPGDRFRKRLQLQEQKMAEITENEADGAVAAKTVYRTLHPVPMLLFDL